MPTFDERARQVRAILRSDLMSFHQKVFQTLEPGIVFKPNWHQEHLCQVLSRVMRGEARRVIINVPPRSGKSLLASVALPAAILGRNPTRRIICVSHTEDLARKFSLDRRAIIQSHWYRGLYPQMQLTSGRPRELELETTRRGSILAAGVGGAILGRGADLIIMDDPIKATEAFWEAGRRHVAEFYDSTMYTRLNDKQTGAILIIMQRLHENDLVGHVLGQEEWEVVSLPAIAPEAANYQLSDQVGDSYHRAAGEVLHEAREPRDVLENLRRVQGSLVFSAQYQQNPVPADGNVIHREWLRYYQKMPRFDRTIVSWDTASTLEDSSDWSVGTVWGAVGLDYYLIAVVRERLESPDLRRRIIEVSARHDADATLIESTELGRALEQDLRRSGDLRALTIRPKFDKRARLEAQSVRFEAGQVYLPAEAPWLATYIHELLAFPNGRNDDQVDSTSQALHFLTTRSVSGAPLVRRDIVRR